MAATGGTITIDGAYKVHTFNSTGSLVVTNSSLTDVQYLVVAGGGGGGGVFGGGGGGGGVVVGTLATVAVGTHTVTIGDGGLGGLGYTNGNNEKGLNGGDSVFGTITATGGGGGGGYSGGTAGNGGSGGGAGYQNGANSTVGTGVAGQGNNGGTMYNDWSAGGGGGAASVGANGSSAGGGFGTGGAGGSGYESSISGTAVKYGGGGGGASRSNAGAGTDGGGTATTTTVKAGNGATNRGGGGGGGGYTTNSNDRIGGDGGSGVVILRYLNNVAPNTPTNSSPANAATGVSRNPTLTASAFSDPDAGDTHKASQWQVATDSGFSLVIWDSGTDTTNKTSTTVNATNGTFAGALAGKTRLASNTQYYWHVRYQDSNDAWSAYS